MLFLGSKESKIQVSYKLFAKMEEATVNGHGKYRPLTNKRVVIFNEPVKQVNFNVSLK